MTSGNLKPELSAEDLAERIASMLKGGDSERPLLAALEDLAKRVEKLESVSVSSVPDTGICHPSLEKHSLSEAASDASEEGKLCGFEPHSRPCDHCSMCSARGF